MSSLFVCWILYPLLLGLVAQGCGTVVERLAGRKLALGVRIPCGMALAMGVMALAVSTSATADLAVPAALVIGAIGLALSPPWRWRLRDPGLAAGAIVFAAFAAPVVLSGMATWTGYIKLDDTATWLALVDRALVDGRTVAGLPLSSYRATLEAYLTVGYPLGSFLPLGIGHTVLGEDIAWLVNPWMATVAGMLAMGLHHIARLALRDRTGKVAPVVVAALAGQPALLYGYYLWGGIKEVVGAMLVVAFAVTAPLPVSGERRLRALIPVAVVLGAIVAALSPGGFVWVGPGVALALVSWALIRSWRSVSSHGPAAAVSVATQQQRSGNPAVRARAQVKPSRPAKPPPGQRSGPQKAPSPEVPTASGQFPPPAPEDLISSSWLAPPWRGWLPAGWRRWTVAVGALALAGLGAYLVLRPGGFVERFSSSLTGSSEWGNLRVEKLGHHQPLKVAQLAGIWPVGDFRYPPSAPGLTYVLIALVVLCALVGLGLALRHARHELALYVLCAVSGALLVALIGSPWVAAKALASASPALPLAALTALAWVGRGGAGLRQALARLRGRRRDRQAGPAESKGALAGWRALTTLELAGAIAVGILWSNVLAYHDANLAPREQMAELAEIGERIAGEGPTFMTEFQTYGVRHFLREAGAEAASELRYADDRLISGKMLEPGEAADIDQFELSEVLRYRTLVLQRSPSGSRPPAPYKLIYADRFWEVWQRPDHLNQAIHWHLPLGGTGAPGSVPNCRALLRMAHRPRVTELVAEPVENPVVQAVGVGTHPAQWGEPEKELEPRGAGTAKLTVTVPSAGRYSVWLGGRTRGPLSIYIDGKLVSTALYELQEAGQYIPFGDVTLTAPGKHSVELRYGGDDLLPGVGGANEGPNGEVIAGADEIVGPLVLRRETRTGEAFSREPFIYVPVSRASTLCGRSLDWVEGLSTEP